MDVRQIRRVGRALVVPENTIRAGTDARRGAAACVGPGNRGERLRSNGIYTSFHLPGCRWPTDVRMSLHCPRRIHGCG